MEKVILEGRKINKSFHDPVTFPVLKDINLVVKQGEFVSMVGRSGSGKSTLLYVLSTMDTDFDGELLIDQESTRRKTEKELAQIRNEKIGFVFQFHYLWNEFTVLENVMLPGLKLKRFSAEETEHRAVEHLKMLGVDKLVKKKASQISGGEKQRVALARALINDPLIVMGDEPTGNLDKKNSEIVFDLFQRMADELKQTLLIVTHDTNFAEKTERIIELDDGRIINS
jgi:lipoprotein-releasing system ATP-binding protein